MYKYIQYCTVLYMYLRTCTYGQYCTVHTYLYLKLARALGSIYSSLKQNNFTLTPGFASGKVRRETAAVYGEFGDSCHLFDTCSYPRSHPTPPTRVLRTVLPPHTAQLKLINPGNPFVLPAASMSKENDAPSAAEKGKGKMDDDKSLDSGKKVDDRKKDKDGRPLGKDNKGEEPQEGWKLAILRMKVY